MCRLGIVLFIGVAICVTYSNVEVEGALLSTLLTPALEKKDKSLTRQGRSYYDPRYGSIRPLYDRPDDGTRCGRCLDDRYDRDDYDRRDRDRDRDRDSYDDDRRSNRPTSGNRYDRNEDEDRKYGSDRRSGKNETDAQDGDKKDKDGDSRPSGSRRRGDRDRDRDRGRDRDRYDDRDRYRPDYYDRFLRDSYERDYYNRYERRPLFDRYPSYDDYGGRYDSYGYSGYRRPVYDDRYDRGYDDGYGGYGPGVGRGPHDSFRPWDETYRGQAGWDAGGRGYYFASGRPDTAPAQAWGRPQYARPESSWQNVDPYRDQLEYRGSVGYPEYGYRQEMSAGYGRPSGWQSVGERRPYRDQSGVNNLEKTKHDYDSLRNNQYAPRQPDSFQSSGASYSTSSTPRTGYLFQRQDEQVTVKSTDNNETPKNT